GRAAAARDRRDLSPRDRAAEPLFPCAPRPAVRRDDPLRRDARADAARALVGGGRRGAGDISHRDLSVARARAPGTIRSMPPSFASRVVRWQRRHGRHDLPWQGTRDPFRIWLSEIMLQQTQVSAVIPYYRRFLRRFPDVGALAAASEEEVLELWSGLGYYARGRNLHRAARVIAQH